MAEQEGWDCPPQSQRQHQHQHRYRYQAALSFLESLPYRLVKPGLERVTRLLEALGNPHLGLRAVHVGGTNGKGSVVALLTAILQAAGYRVGSYTSPHLRDWCERIRIDGEPIPRAEFARLIGLIAPHARALADRPTPFEVVTAAAFKHFEGMVDLALVEVGLGGRFDATNVLNPLLAILTNVGPDHLDLLGPRLEDVAWEKAGIAKKGVPLLTGERAPGLLRVIAEECRARGAELVRPDVEPELRDYDWERQVFRVPGWGELELGLLGPYQRENLALALEAVRLLRARGLEVPDEAVREGLRRARWPGRFEVVGRKPYLILDGAHNPAGTAALRAGLELYYRKFIAPAGGRRWLVFGALADKDLKSMVGMLFPWFDQAIVTRPDYYRAAAPELLLELAHTHAPSTPVKAIVPAREALAVARAGADSRDLIVATGSLYLVGELWGEMRGDER